LFPKGPEMLSMRTHVPTQIAGSKGGRRSRIGRWGAIGAHGIHGFHAFNARQLSRQMASTRHRTCIRTIRKVWIRTDVITAAVASCLGAVAETTLPETEADPRLLGLELGRLAGQKDDTAAEVERQEEAARPRRRHPKGLQGGPGHLQGCEAGERGEDGRRQVQPSEQQLTRRWGAKPARTENMGVGRYSQASRTAAASANSATNATPEADATTMFFKGASPT